MESARKLCPELQAVPYDFPAYAQVSAQVYKILHKHSLAVQCVSVDEAFLDVSHFANPLSALMERVGQLRNEVFEATGCRCSAGIGPNIFLARMATRRAKPDGQFMSPTDAEEIKTFLSSVPIADFPHVGWRRKKLFIEKGVNTGGDAMELSRQTLREMIGGKHGDVLFDVLRGKDERGLTDGVGQRRSIGAQVSWGVRLHDEASVAKMISDLTDEVSRRLTSAGFLGGALGLKVWKRKDTAGEPAKFLGHGHCDIITRSVKLGTATSDSGVLAQATQAAIGALKLSPLQIRGLGITATKLCKPGDAPIQGLLRDQPPPRQLPVPQNASLSRPTPPPQPDLNAQSNVTEDAEAMPRPSQLDPRVILGLPADVVAELRQEYTRRGVSLARAPGPLHDGPAAMPPPSTTVPERSSNVVRAGRVRREEAGGGQETRAGGGARKRANEERLVLPGGEGVVDMDVFRALPDEIQQEVQRRARRRVGAMAAPVGGAAPVVGGVGLDSGRREESERTGGEEDGANWEGFSAVRKVMCQWLEQLETVGEAEQRLLVHVAQGYADNRRFEDAALLLRTLTRLSASHPCLVPIVTDVASVIDRAMHVNCHLRLAPQLSDPHDASSS